MTALGKTGQTALLLFVLVLIVYFPSFWGEFIFDDWGYLINNPVIRTDEGLKNIWLGRGTIDYWPISFTAIWAQFRIFGEDPFGYHLINTFLHFLVSIYVGIILKQMGFRWAWWAAFLFALHPANVETVAWVIEQKTLLASLLILISLFFFLKFERDSKKKFLLFSLMAFALSLLTKTQGASLPLLFLLWGSHRWGLRKALLWCSPYFLLSAVAAGIAFIVMGPYQPGGSVSVGWSQVYESFFRFGYYMEKAFWPFDLSLVYPTTSIQVMDFGNILRMSCLILILAGLWKFRRNELSKFLLFSVFAAWLILFPVLGFFSISFMQQTPITDHWQYLALPIWCAMIAATVDRIWSRAGKNFALSVLILTSLLFGGLSLARTKVFKNEIELWSDAAQKNPKSAFVHYNLGTKYFEKKSFPEARVHLEKAIELQKSYAKAEYNLAMTKYAMNLRAEALGHFKKVLEMAPSFRAGALSLALCAQNLGLEEEASSAFQKAIESQTDFAFAHFQYALFLVKQKQFKRAEEQLVRALQLPPLYWDQEFAVKIEFTQQLEAKKVLASVRASTAEP
jgi:Tfp pilus assembly protein PilF